MSRVYEDAWANPSSPHEPGRRASQALEQARHQVGQYLGRPFTEITFTSGATESNAWALGTDIPGHTGRRIVSAIEHPSVLAWADQHVKVDPQGRVCIDHLRDLLNEYQGKIGIVSVMAANNETGVLQPVEAIAEACAQAGVLFHCDATQVPGRWHMDLTLPDLLDLAILDPIPNSLPATSKEF